MRSRLVVGSASQPSPHMSACSLWCISTSLHPVASSSGISFRWSSATMAPSCIRTRNDSSGGTRHARGPRLLRTVAKAPASGITTLMESCSSSNVARASSVMVISSSPSAPRAHGGGPQESTTRCAYSSTLFFLAHASLSY